MIRRELGYSMHVFLLDIPRVEFAALIPKGDYVTLCMLGDNLDKELVAQFITADSDDNVHPSSFCGRGGDFEHPIHKKPTLSKN